MPTVREVVFSVFVALGVGIIAYGITLQSEIGIFLATAMGSFSVAAFAFWDNYASVAKLQIEFKGEPDVNFITLTELDKNGDPLFDYHQIRVVVRNRGRKTATGCTGWMELVDRPSEGCSLFTRQPTILEWVELPEGRQIAPHGGFGLLGVAQSISRPLRVPDERCKVKGNDLLHTWANNKNFWILGGNDLLQYSFCAGDWKVRITVFSATSYPVSRQFVLKVKSKWEDLEMVKEKPPSSISTAQKLVTKGPLARILRYLGLAVLIVVANYVIGILTVNNLSLIPSWVWSLLAIPSISIPFALAFGFKGNRGKRLLVKYTSILVAAEVFVIVKISDTLTSLIPSLFGLSVLNLAVFVAFISIVGCFLWLVDYVKEFPKIVSASLEKKEPDKR